MPETAVVTAADIARLAGVTRATVSNWRRRHPDFPAPSGGTDASPAYDRAEVEEWLTARGSLLELSPDMRLWRAVLDAAGEEDLGDLVAWAALALRDSAVDRPRPRTATVTESGAGKQARILADLADAAAAYGPRQTLSTLIDRYADAAGVAVTPRPVADLMAALGEPRHGVVLDPASGTGELLEAALDQGAARVLGQELDAALAQMAEIRLGMSTRSGTAEIKTGDSLLDDGFTGVQADAVLCHPPFAGRDWGQAELAHDVRWEYGLPPKSEPELAWVQDALAHLRPGGRAVVVMPPAVASRPSARRIRAELLRRGAWRAVISLPSGAVRPYHVPVHLWVLDRPIGQGPVDPRVLLVDGATRADLGGSESTLASASWQELSDTVLTAWRSFTGDSAVDDGEAGRWRVVRAIDLLDEAVDVSPARHVAPLESGKLPSQTVEEARAMQGRLRTALAALEHGLPGGDWPSGADRPSWRTASVAELARNGLVEIHRGAATAPRHADLAGQDLFGAWAVLRAADVLQGDPPSGTVPDGDVESEWVKIRSGDVIIPAVASGSFRARVATQEDHGAFLGQNLHLVRPNVALIDPWFLAGLLVTPASVQQASYGTTFMRIDARRLVVPLLPLPEQQRYGAVFRRLHAFDSTARQIADLAEDLTGLLARGLAEGALLPGEWAEI